MTNRRYVRFCGLVKAFPLISKGKWTEFRGIGLVQSLFLNEKPLLSEYATAWYGKVLELIIGSVSLKVLCLKDWFFTVRCACDHAILTNHVLPAFQGRNTFEITLFMQDGAHPFISAQSKNVFTKLLVKIILYAEILNILGLLVPSILIHAISGILDT